jgi:hypothetical protein
LFDPIVIEGDAGQSMIQPPEIVSQLTVFSYPSQLSIR